MEIRILVALVVLGGLMLAVAAWRRPPRRLAGATLEPLGVTEPAIVQFTSPTCGPCKAAAPKLRSTAEDASVTFLQVDVIERPDVARAFGVRRVPTIAVTGADGEVLGVWSEPSAEIAEVAFRARAAV
jgi:thiol-disulfide isomerase/thioredoxin